MRKHFKSIKTFLMVHLLAFALVSFHVETSLGDGRYFVRNVLGPCAVGALVGNLAGKGSEYKKDAVYVGCMIGIGYTWADGQGYGYSGTSTKRDLEWQLAEEIRRPIMPRIGN